MTSTSSQNNLLTRSRSVNQSPVEQSADTLNYTKEITGEKALYCIEVPGVDPSTLNVSFEETYLKVDCSKGSILLTVGPTFDMSKISADVKWGMLTLTLPRRATHSVKINVLDQMSKPSSASHKKSGEEPNSEKE
jgi:HSP20 family molecular chaperone IbpA